MPSPFHLIHANVLLLNDDQPQAEAVLVGGRRVLAVGSREELRALAPKAKIHDHRDLLLTPGLADAHTHLVMYGFSLDQVNLHGTSSLEEVQNKLAEKAIQTPKGNWIQGSGFLANELGFNDYPTAEMLDQVTPHHPVILFSRDHHSAWVNNLALKIANVTEDTPHPEGGKIVHPLGCLLENAARLVSQHIPKPTEAEYLAAARAGADDLASRGYVSAHTMAFEPAEAPRALQTLAQRGELALRVWACLPHDRLEHAQKLGLANQTGGLFQWGGVKFFADGALGSRTAWLHKPGFADGNGLGMALDDPETIYERGLQALELGLTPVTHAIGDRANTEMLNIYEKLQPTAKQKGIQLRIEHAQHLQPSDLVRFKGLVASVQPIHLHSDGPMIRKLLPHLESSTYAFRSLKEAGAILAFGSDAPIAPPDYRANFAAAMNRKDHSGETIAASESLSELDVLWAHTRGPAIAAGWKDEGIIQPGARAAFTLWDHLGGEAKALVL